MNGMGATLTAPQKEAEIPAALGRLFDAIDQNEKAAAVFIQRVSKVMRNEPDSAQAEDQAKPGAGCEMAGAIREATTRLQRITRLVNRMTERIEL